MKGFITIFNKYNLKNIISISSIALIEDAGNDSSLITLKEKNSDGSHIGIRTQTSIKEIEDMIESNKNPHYS